MIDTRIFLRRLCEAAEAHDHHTFPQAAPSRLLRNGEENPYWTHSLWCAMMILLEPQLPESIRVPGAYALLFHDVVEDTSFPLPPDLPEDVKSLIMGMTYFGGFEEEKIKVPNKPPIVQLLKLCDKTATLYDCGIPLDLYVEWFALMETLIATVEMEYGNLNIVSLARDLIARYKAQAL